MLLPRRTAFLFLPSWFLLFSWVCFGGLDLLEQVNLMPEVDDQDEEALEQLAAGLKSEVSSHDGTYHTSLAEAVTRIGCEGEYACTRGPAVRQVECA